MVPENGERWRKRRRKLLPLVPHPRRRFHKKGAYTEAVERRQNSSAGAATVNRFRNGDYACSRLVPPHWKWWGMRKGRRRLLRKKEKSGRSRAEKSTVKKQTKSVPNSQEAKYKVRRPLKEIWLLKESPFCDPCLSISLSVGSRWRTLENYLKAPVLLHWSVT